MHGVCPHTCLHMVNTYTVIDDACYVAGICEFHEPGPPISGRLYVEVMSRNGGEDCYFFMTSTCTKVFPYYSLSDLVSLNTAGSRRKAVHFDTVRRLNSQKLYVLNGLSQAVAPIAIVPNDILLLRSR